MRRTFRWLALAAWCFAACSTRPAADEAARTTPDAMPDRPAQSAAPADTVSGDGVITYLDLEGGFYGLVADDGARYDPLNLDDAFRQDSLRVRFRALRRTGVMTIRQWGQPVEILHIERLGDPND